MIFPLSIIATLSQMASTSAMLWVARIMVLPSFLDWLCRNSLMLLAVITSRPMVGSSRKTTLGSFTNALAMVALCLYPVDRA